MEAGPALVQDDVARRRLEQVRGGLPGLDDGLDRSLVHGAAAELQRPRTQRAAAPRHLIGVAVDDGDAVERNAELF